MSLRGASLRDASATPFSLFSFQDIVFCVTGILLLTAVFFALATRLDRFSREPAQASEDTALRAAIDQEVAARRDALNRGRLIAEWERTSTAAPASAVVPAVSGNSVDARLRFLDDAALAQENEPLFARYHQLQSDLAARVHALDQAETAWLELQQRILELEQDQRHILVRPVGDPSLKETVLLVISDQGAQLEWFGHGERNELLPLPVREEEWARFFARFTPAQQRLVLFFKPSGASTFDRLRAEFRRRGFQVGLEPVPENFSANLYSPAAARRLLMP